MPVYDDKDFWNKPQYGPMVASIISQWLYSCVYRTEMTRQLDKDIRHDFVASLCAKKYPQRFMEFALKAESGLRISQLINGYCGCGNDAEFDHNEMDKQLDALFAMRGKPWKRLSCAITQFSLAIPHDFAVIDYDSVLTLVDAALLEFPDLADRMDWEVVRDTDVEAAEWPRKCRVARARGKLYAQVCLTYGIAEDTGLDNPFLPYHEFDSVLEECSGAEQIGETLWQMLLTSEERYENYYQRCVTAAERIYRVRKDNPDYEATIAFLLRYPRCAGVNLDIAARLLAQLRMEMRELGMWDAYERMMLLILQTFGKNSELWVNRFSGSFETKVHDASQCIPSHLSLQVSKRLGRYLMKYIKSNIVALTVVSRNWEHAPDNAIDIAPDQLKYELVGNALPHDGTEIGHKFSFESALWGVKKADWPEVYAAFQAAQAVPLPYWASLEAQCGAYRGRFLSRSDPRGQYLGHYTNCCQHPHGNAASCAQHGQESPYGAFFVIEDATGDIAAMSWVWEGLRGICFDSIESKGLGNRRIAAQKIYREVAAHLLEFPDIDKVTTGNSHRAFDEGGLEEMVPPMPFIDGYEGYTDAKRQFYLAK